MKRRLALAAALALPLLFGAAFVLPGRIDWDGYRGTLAQHASDRLGRPIGLNGGLRLRLLPQTVLDADGLTIGASDDGVELTARALRLRLDPWRLLLGRVVVREVVLLGADIRLPWPPTRLPGLATLGLDALTLLDARLEDSRISVAGAAIEGVAARLVAGGLADALRAEGRFNWRGQPLAFNATLGRAGDDGVAPLEIIGQVAGSRITARGVLLAEGGFEGRLDAAGQDLSALLPTPRGAFSATGRITATADVVGVDQLALELAGQQARGGISLRLAAEARADAPAPAAGTGARLDAALLASRLDLDAWTDAIRRDGSPALPIGLDLSAEAASFRDITLRRLRLAVQLENGRILVPEASAELAGETTINASGAGTADASEWALRFNARRAPEALAGLTAVRLPVGAIPPGPAAGTMRLVLDERQATFSNMALSLDGNRVAGTASWRWGERPVLGLGLEFARLELDPWLDTSSGAAERLGQMDVNLRIAAERASLLGATLEALSIDAAAEGGRIVLRRALARHGAADITLAASGTLAPPRLNEAVLEAQGGTLGGALAPWLAPPETMAALPLRLRARLAGPPEALALRAEASLDDARLEAQLTIDAGQRHATGAVTLRHPGAARLLGPWLGPAGRQWLGDGSLAVIAGLALRPGSLAAENLDVVAGQLRLRGPLTLNSEGARPRVSGQIATESLVLPEPAAQPALALLQGIDLELALRAENLLLPWGAPPLSGLRAMLRLDDGRLAIDIEEGRLSGGALQGVLRADAHASPPGLSLEGRVEGAVLTEPMFGQAPDVTSGRADVELALTAQGHGGDAWRATLAGRGQVLIRDGTLLGLDIAALREAAAMPDAPAAQAAMAAALAGGSTPFASLILPFTAQAGLLELGGARLEGEAGTARLAGGYDLPRHRLALRLALPQPEGPDVGIWFGGGADSRRRLPEMSDYWRWRNARE